MKTIEDLKFYFETTLNAQLAALETRRVQVVNRYSFKPYKRFLKIGGVVSILAIVLSINLPDTFKYAPFVVLVYVLTAIVYPLVLLYKRSTQFEAVNKACKESIIPKLLSFIDPEIHYQPEKGIASDAFNNSLLFTGRPLSGYLSDDLIEFKVNGNAVQVANIEARRLGDKHQGQSSKNYVAFSGLFARTHYTIASEADIIVKKDIRNSAVANAGKAVFGDALGGIIDTVATRFESLNITGERVKIDDPDFEGQFNVYCSEPETARRVLNDKVRQAMTTYAKQNDQDVHFSFTANHLNVALWATKYLEWEDKDSFHDFEKFKSFLLPVLQSINLVSVLLEAKAHEK
jgi:Protein of unknown function (DUF3137)